MPVTFAAPRNQCACGVSAGTHALTVFNQCAGDVSPDPAADAEHAPAAHAAPGKLVPEAHALTVFKQRAWRVRKNAADTPVKTHGHAEFQTNESMRQRHTQRLASWCRRHTH